MGSPIFRTMGHPMSHPIGHIGFLMQRLKLTVMVQPMGRLTCAMRQRMEQLMGRITADGSFHGAGAFTVIFYGETVPNEVPNTLPLLEWSARALRTAQNERRTSSWVDPWPRLGLALRLGLGLGVN